MELVPKAEFSIVTRASSKAWIPELIAAAGPEVIETYIDFFTAAIRNRNTIGHGFVECAVCCLARNTYLIRAGLTPQLTPLLSIVSSHWFIFHCARLAGYRTGFFLVLAII